MLVPLHIVEERTLHTDGDTVAAVRAEGDGVGCQAPAVEVTANPYGHIRHFIGDKVVAGVEVEGPVLRGLEVSREHQAMRQPVVVLVPAWVEGGALQVHPIAQRDAPWDLDLQIAVFVVLAIAVVGIEETLALLPLGSHIRQRGVAPIFGSAYLAGVIFVHLPLDLLALRVLVVLLRGEEVTDLGEGLVAQRVAEGSTCATQATEALAIEDTELIDTVFADTPRSGVGGMAVEIGIEGTSEGKVDRLREAQRNTRIDVRQLEGVGSEVVARAEGEVVDETDLLEGVGAVALRAHLHLEVVVDAEVDGGTLSPTRTAEDLPIAVARILLRACFARAVDIVQAVVIAPHSIPEVGGEAHPHTWGNAVTDHLHLIAEDLPRLEEAVEGGIQAGRRGEVVDTVEAVDPAVLGTVGRRIVLLDGLVGVPALVVVSTQRQVDVVKELVRG